MDRQPTYLDLEKQQNAVLRPEDSHTKEKSADFVYKGFLGVIGIAILGLSIANLVIFLQPKDKSALPLVAEADTEQANNSSSNNDVFNIAFDDLNKEQTIQAYKLMHEPGYMPSGFADPTIALTNNETSLALDYSYSSMEEVYELDHHVSNFGKNELNIDPVGDYYVVISTDDYKEKHSPAYWPKAISFNKKYVDYRRETINNSTNDVVNFNDTSAQTVRITLPVLAATNLMSQTSSIFSFDFSEDDTKYVLSMNCIGIGFDFEAYAETYDGSEQPNSIDDYPYAITHYTTIIELNKESGVPSWIKSDDGSVSHLKESFRLDTQELTDLYGYFY